MSGLLDVAMAGGYVVKPSNGWYAKAEDPDRKFRLSQLDAEFFDPLLNDEGFQEYVRKAYSVGSPMDDSLDFEVEE